MELFLAGVLTGSTATRQRHLWQAKLIHAEIAERWQLDTPWVWRRKHVAWFLYHCQGLRSEATRYYYSLTVRLLVRRLGKLGYSTSEIIPSGCRQYSATLCVVLRQPQGIGFQRLWTTKQSHHVVSSTRWLDERLRLCP